jgi:transcriptional regulator with XRE-family HTH domain
MINISPNYLNAVENGKNFPSPEVIQNISTALELLPYQLFLERPVDLPAAPEEEKIAIIQDLTYVKQKCIREIDAIIKKYEGIHKI